MMSANPAKQKAACPSDILSACSPANLYLVQLLEDKKSVSFEAPSEARIQLVFQVLHRLIPELGVYSELVKLIAEEIYGAVYSPCLTGNSALPSQPAEEVTQIPYFTLLTRIQDERNEEAEKAISELQHANKILSEREEITLQQKRDTEELQKKCQTLRQAIAALEEDVRMKSEERKRLQKDRQTQVEKLVEQIYKLKACVQNLQLQLQASWEQINSLKPYKEAYDELQEALQSPVEKKTVNSLSPIAVKVPTKRRALIGCQQAHAVSYLETTEHLYQQLLQVQNQAMDDFDTYVESHVKLSMKLLEHAERPLSRDEKLDLHTLEKEELSHTS